MRVIRFGLCMIAFDFFRSLAKIFNFISHMMLIFTSMSVAVVFTSVGVYIFLVYTPSLRCIVQCASHEKFLKFLLNAYIEHMSVV